MQDQPTLSGLCECGCGQTTPIVTMTSTARGRIKGQPSRFVVGHATRLAGHAYDKRDCGYETPCWVWARGTNQYGYGTTYRAGRMRLAHVVLWEERHGSVPDGRELDHLCRNPRCVNPDHLEAVTHRENLRRGRGTRLSAEDVAQIRASADSQRTLAERYGVSRATISSVLTYRTWRVVD